jgi:hypothetical protein
LPNYYNHANLLFTKNYHLLKESKWTERIINTFFRNELLNLKYLKICLKEKIYLFGSFEALKGSFNQKLQNKHLLLKKTAFRTKFKRFI